MPSRRYEYTPFDMNKSYVSPPFVGEAFETRGEDWSARVANPETLPGWMATITLKPTPEVRVDRGAGQVFATREESEAWVTAAAERGVMFLVDEGIIQL